MKIDKAKQLKFDDFKVKLVSALPEKQLKQIFGGTNACHDSKDCNSELASGGGTTDTYEIAEVAE